MLALIVGVLAYWLCTKETKTAEEGQKEAVSDTIAADSTALLIDSVETLKIDTTTK